MWLSAIYKDLPKRELCYRSPVEGLVVDAVGVCFIDRIEEDQYVVTANGNEYMLFHPDVNITDVLPGDWLWCWEQDGKWLWVAVEMSPDQRVPTYKFDPRIEPEPY